MLKKVLFASLVPFGLLFFGMSGECFADANEVSVTVYEYDNAGQVTKETIQEVNDVAVTEYQYDELGRRWQVRRRADVAGSDDANDMITLYSYDTRSNLKKTVRKVDPNAAAIEPNDIVTENFYDAFGSLTDVNDPNGGNTHYTYYTGGLLYDVNDPNGNITTNYYDNAGRLEEIVDAEDHYRANYYDSLGQTIKQIACDSDDNKLMQTRFEYNGVGRVTRRAVMADADSAADVNTSNDMVVDYNYPADGNGLLMDETSYYFSGTAATTYYEYDDLGRRTDINDPGGNLTLFTYDEVGRVTRRQQIDYDPLGSNDLWITNDYVYDSLGRLYQQVAKPDVSDSNTWQTTIYDYDALGNRIQETTPNSVVIKYSYNALAQLVEKIADYGTGKINQTTEYGYDRLGRQTSITGYADGSTAQTTNYTYDKLDRIINVEYPDAYEIDFEYNPAGRVANRIDQRGIVTTYAYDGTYNMLTKSVNGNSVTDDANEIFTYDGLGRMLTATKEVAGLGTISESEFAYNAIGRITEANEALFGDQTPAEIRYTYDQAGHPNSIKYPTGLTINITPDWQGRIDTIGYSTVTVATYKYIGSRVAQRYYPSPKDVKFEPEYDNLGRVTKIHAYQGGTDIVKFDYEYAANTNNISQQKYDHRTNPDDPCTLFSYDNLDRLTTADYGIQSEDEVFTMDDLGNRTNVNLRDDSNDIYLVDNLTNRYTSIFDDANNVAFWKMDDDANNTTVVDSSGNGNDGTAQDNTENLHTSGKVGGALSFDGTYDYVDLGDNNDFDFGTGDFTVSAWIKPEALGINAGIASKWSGSGSAQAWWLSVRTDDTVDLGIYDGAQKIASTTKTLSQDTWYHIVGLRNGNNAYVYLDGQLYGSVSGVDSFNVSNTTEARIGRGYSGGWGFNGLIDNVMIFDRALIEEEISALYNVPGYDDAGNLTADKDGYEYEYDYENRIVKITKDSSDVAEFAYDALGRRIRTIDRIAGETIRYYYNNNWQVLVETDANDTLKKVFVYGNYIDEVLLRWPLIYYLHDHLYSPVALTNTFGAVLERYEYDAYGDCSILEPNFAPDPDGKSDYGNPYLFTGRRVDIMDNSSLKIQYNRNRYYDHYTGRFTTHDTLGYVDGLNLYEYVKNAPIKFLDPFGTSKCTRCEHLYIKQCWIIERGIDWRLGKTGTSFSYEVGIGTLWALARGKIWAAADIAGGIASIVTHLFPSLDYIDWIDINPYRREYYVFNHFKCGKNCMWDWRNARRTQEKVKKTGGWDGTDIGPIALLDYDVQELVKLNKKSIVRVTLFPSKYCRKDRVRCKKGDDVYSPDGAKPKQKCEKFKWKTQD